MQIDSGKVKVFRDPVHGYIEVPSIIVKKLIDTEQFQRLKFIEQTSMRALFPAARHDRFVHSLGTYWLGVKAFKGLKKNSLKILEKLKGQAYGESLSFLTENWWKKHELLFQIACLMHDCAHAPFSHTLEEYYNIPRNEGETEYTKLSWLLCSRCSELGDDSFMTEFYEIWGSSDNSGVGKAHEQMSSLLILMEYIEPIREIFDKLLGVTLQGQDYVFICRAIIGCRYSEETAENSLKNCIISLLNSDLIDVDGLDYTVRDAQMSGMSAYDIDYGRLLNSFTILPISVYKNVAIKDQNIDGLWLKDSQFHAIRMEQCTVNTAASVIIKEKVFQDCFQDFSPTNANSAPRIAKRFRPSGEKITARIDHAENFDLNLIDSGRIINSLFTGEIVKGKKILENESSANSDGQIAFVLAYDKRCLSVIQNTLNARNDEYLWVYSHPKVMYCSNYLQCELLKLSAKYLCCKCNSKISQNEELSFNCESCDVIKKKRGFDCFITHVLGYDFLLDRPEDEKIKKLLQKKGYFFYRTNDDDLNALFKRISLENSMLGEKRSKRIEKLCKEYFSRKQKKALWKSFTEYRAICLMLKESSPHRKLQSLLDECEEKLQTKNEKYTYIDGSNLEAFDKKGFSDVLAVFGNSKTKQIMKSEFFVKYEDRVEQLGKLFDENMLKEKTDLQLQFVFADARDEWNHQTIKAINDSL